LSSVWITHIDTDVVMHTPYRISMAANLNLKWPIITWFYITTL